MISKFQFVCELLPFVKYLLFSDEITIIIAWAKSFQMFEFNPMVFRNDNFGTLLKIFFRTLVFHVLKGRKVEPMGRTKGR